MPSTMPDANDIWLVHLPARRPTWKQFKVEHSEAAARQHIKTAKHYVRRGEQFRARLFRQRIGTDYPQWDLIEQWGDWDE